MEVFNSAGHVVRVGLPVTDLFTPKDGKRYTYLRQK